MNWKIFNWKFFVLAVIVFIILQFSIIPIAPCKSYIGYGGGLSLEWTMCKGSIIDQAGPPKLVSLYWITLIIESLILSVLIIFILKKLKK